MCATFITAKLDPIRLLPHIAISTPRNVLCIAELAAAGVRSFQSRFRLYRSVLVMSRSLFFFLKKESDPPSPRDGAGNAGDDGSWLARTRRGGAQRRKSSSHARSVSPSEGTSLQHAGTAACSVAMAGAVLTPMCITCLLPAFAAPVSGAGGFFSAIKVPRMQAAGRERR